VGWDICRMSFLINEDHQSARIHASQNWTWPSTSSLWSPGHHLDLKRNSVIRSAGSGVCSAERPHLPTLSCDWRTARPSYEPGFAAGNRPVRSTRYQIEVPRDFLSSASQLSSPVLRNVDHDSFEDKTQSPKSSTTLESVFVGCRCLTIQLSTWFPFSRFLIS
jgi:hypothetical protein